MNYVEITFDTLFGFLGLFILTKLLGKTQITQITAFDFIAALVLGELVGNALYDPDTGIVEIGFAILLWGILIYTTEIVTQKWKRTRNILEGQPSIIINHGKIDRQSLKKNKLDVNQLLHLLRAKDVFSVQDVAYAILETDGTVSVMKNDPAQVPTKDDFSFPVQNLPLPRALITDGEIIEDNLKELGKDETWLHRQLKKQKIDSAKEVMYAEYKEGESLFLLKL
ncbi:DUF421 domain-containing protein [Salimicrobium halophilum]|uniref:Uncharacterized membrane protein YcaP, DUF421 family n=1 Tax=Salimicrobium halophilum TaxID=86666 RepID=A0A1G8TWX6_9BACI|nr:DUF421 domain-containing protein [Salimicrobium halophilum]SDJ45230.1 Uncharacterized membrane protein YcaP, DUF421 family [Salimicrobium halophilum]